MLTAGLYGVWPRVVVPGRRLLGWPKASMAPFVGRPKTGIDVISEGEMGKYSWLWYMFERLDGFAPVDKRSYAAGNGAAFGGLGEYQDLASRTYATAGLDRPRTVMASVEPVVYSNLEPMRRATAPGGWSAAPFRCSTTIGSSHIVTEIGL